MQGIARQSNIMRNFFTVIDVFSKFAWAFTVYSKKGKAITGAIKQMLTTAKPRHPRRLQSDKGKELFNPDFQRLMKRHGIQHFASESVHKAAVVKRFNRTIKTRI